MSDEPGDQTKAAPPSGQDAGDAPSRTGLWAFVGVAGAVAVLAVIALVVDRSGIFTKNTSASDAQILAAMMTVVGTLVAAGFTLVGVLLKNAIDRHNLRLQQDAERNRERQAREAEARLRLETSIKAVELLTMPDGQPAPRARQAGALFVLGSKPLQQLDLALALLNEHWESGNISSSAAVWVIDQALAQDREWLQSEAGLTLRRHAALLPNRERDNFDWPSCLDYKWPLSVHYRTRTTLLEACARLFAAFSRDDAPKVVRWFIAEFDVIRETDDKADIKAGATLVLDVLLESQLRSDPDAAMMMPSGRVHLASLRDEIAPALEGARIDVSQQMLDLVVQLRRQSGGTEDPGPAPA